jgi:hypothetical protein
MPEFKLNADRFGSHPYYKLSDFAKGYVEAMFFTNGDTGDDNENILNELGVEKLTREAVKDIAKDCDTFLGIILEDGCFMRQWLDRAIEEYGYTDERAGHDFWFTRQGHGVGFWDRELGEVGRVMDREAEKFGEAYCEVSRGWIYHC